MTLVYDENGQYTDEFNALIDNQLTPLQEQLQSILDQWLEARQATPLDVRLAYDVAGEWLIGLKDWKWLDAITALQIGTLKGDEEYKPKDES